MKKFGLPFLTIGTLCRDFYRLSPPDNAVLDDAG
jgi:hypothetical protein